MKIDRITDPDSGTSYNVMIADDFERINPIDFVFSNFFNTSMILYSGHPEVQKLNLPKDVLNKVLLKRTLCEWDKEYNEIISRPIPPVLLELLESKSKKTKLDYLKTLF